MDFLLFFSLFILGISYLIFNFVRVTDIFKKFEPDVMNSEKCIVVKGALGIEDIVKYKNNFLIGGSSDRGRLWLVPIFKTNIPDGKLIYVKIKNDEKNKIQINDLKIKNMHMKNFPKDIGFHPHGIYLHREKFLYVINHAYDRGGERVEVFEIKENQDSKNGEPLYAEYLRSIKFADNFSGLFNDLIVIGDNDEILITKYLPIRDPKESGRHSDLYLKIRYALLLALKLPWTSVYHCRASYCTEVLGTEAMMNNGITWDEDNKLVYVSQLPEKRVRVFTLEKNDDDKKILKFQYDINSIHSLDNLEFDKNNGIISAGVVGRIFDHMMIEQNIDEKKSLEGVGKRWGGSLTIDTKKENKVEIQVIQNSMFYGVSSSIKDGNIIYHGSSVDNGILVCDLDEKINSFK